MPIHLAYNQAVLGTILGSTALYFCLIIRLPDIVCRRTADLYYTWILLLLLSFFIRQL